MIEILLNVYLFLELCRGYKSRRLRNSDDHGSSACGCNQIPLGRSGHERMLWSPSRVSVNRFC